MAASTAYSVMSLLSFFSVRKWTLRLKKVRKNSIRKILIADLARLSTSSNFP